MDEHTNSVEGGESEAVDFDRRGVTASDDGSDRARMLTVVLLLPTAWEAHI